MQAEKMKIYIKNMVCNRCKMVVKTILEKLELSIKDEVNPGLGTLNRL